MYMILMKDTVLFIANITKSIDLDEYHKIIRKEIYEELNIIYD